MTPATADLYRRRARSAARRVVAVGLPVAVAGALVVATAPDSSAANAVTTKRVTIGSSGEPADNGGGGGTDVSAAGRYVCFSSRSTNLVPGDTNGGFDVFVRDRQTAATVRVSVSDSGAQVAGSSGECSISGNGRYVAFVSTARVLVPGDSNGVRDVFVRDVVAGTTTMASLTAAGQQFPGRGIGGDPDISADGRTVAFTWGVYPRLGVYVRTLARGTTTLASVDTTGGGPTTTSYHPSLSADASAVAFESREDDLVPGDTNGGADVFVRDLRGRTTVRASVPDAGGQAGSGSGAPSISGDGRSVAFTSAAPDLVPGDTNGQSDVFVRTAGRTTREDLAGSGAQSTGDAFSPALSADGRYLAFASDADDLVPGDSNVSRDVFLRDRLLGSTTRVSVATDGSEARYGGESPSISGAGGDIAFESVSGDLVPDDTNDGTDVFVRELGW